MQSLYAVAQTPDENKGSYRGKLQTHESFTITRARACKVHRGIINCWAFTYEGHDTKFWDIYSKKALFRMLGFPIPEEKFQQPNHQILQGNGLQLLPG
jgi:hypothetical protein